jgi:hypothetical protein
VSAALSILLDSKRIDGVHEVVREVGPMHHAVCVDRHDAAHAFAAIELQCQAWGGATNLLIPLERGGRRLRAAWRDLVATTPIEALDRNGVTTAKRPLEGPYVLAAGWIEPLLSVLFIAGQGPSSWRKCAVPRLSLDNPWAISYYATLGTWPEKPADWVPRAAGLKPTIAWSDVVPTVFEEVTSPGPDDLLARLRSPETTTPSRLTMALLEHDPAPANTGSSVTDFIPLKHKNAYFAGPNVVVVYEPGSVDDLCLLWSLRAAHGQRAAAPLGIPVTGDLGAGLDRLRQLEAVRPFGLFGIAGDDPPVITSMSVSEPDLQRVLASRSDKWRVVPAASLLQPPRPATRRSTDIALFSEGEAQVRTWAPEDRQLLGERRYADPLRAAATFRLARLRLPPSPTLGGRFPYSSEFANGGYRTQVRDMNHVATTRWPSGWTVIEALAKDRGLTALPSQPGRAAAALLRRMGSFEHLMPLSFPPILDLLFELSERSGMSWFRARLRQIVAGMESAELDARALRLTQEIEALRLVGYEEHQHDVTFSRVQTTLNNERDLAKDWLRWAESAGILVRGTRAECRVCGSRPWHAIAEFGQSLTCRGCGSTMTDPFQVDRVDFRYRVSAQMLRVVETDSFPHLLAARWLMSLFSTVHESETLGFYPGVEFKDTASGEIIGEADVLLVMSDGDLVVGECKRSAAGLVSEEIDKLDRLTERLGSRWSFLSTLEPSRACGTLWKESVRYDDKHCRLVFTGDRLFARHPSVSLGANAVEWIELNEAETAAQNDMALQLLMGFDVLRRLIGERHSEHDLLEFGST